MWKHQKWFVHWINGMRAKASASNQTASLVYELSTAFTRLGTVHIHAIQNTLAFNIKNCVTRNHKRTSKSELFLHWNCIHYRLVNWAVWCIWSQWSACNTCIMNSLSLSVSLSLIFDQKSKQLPLQTPNYVQLNGIIFMRRNKSNNSTHHTVVPKKAFSESLQH